jgi:ketosteroid isomerase-like protein
MSDKNVETLRLAHAAYEAGEFDAAVDMYLHPEIVWETRWPGLPTAYHGRDGVREWQRQVLEAVAIRMALVDARALDDETVLASYVLRGAGRSSGVETEMKVFDVMSFRNGMIVRRQTFYSEEEAVAAADPSNPI